MSLKQKDASNNFPTREDIVSKLSDLLYGLAVNLNFVDDFILTLPERVGDDDLYVALSEYIASLVTLHYDYGKLAGRVAVARIYRHTKGTFSGLYFNLFIRHHITSILTRNIYHFRGVHCHVSKYPLQRSGPTHFGKALRHCM